MKRMSDPIAVLAIVGQTASGKSALAMALAERLGGELVCGDAFQVYRHCDVGTASPTEGDMRAVPHHLFSYVDPRESYNLARYIADAQPVIREIASRGKLPIVVGGTGLYVDTLLRGTRLSAASADRGYRAHLRTLSEAYGNAYLYAMLCSIAPSRAAIIHPNDHRRTARALELTLSGDGDLDADLYAPLDPLYVIVDITREILYNRIERRVDDMLSNGLIDEVRMLVDMGVDERHTCMQGIGYKEVYAYLRGETDYASAVELIKQRTRRYAKRQGTWFRKHEALHVPYEYDSDILDRLIEQIKSSAGFLYSL